MSKPQPTSPNQDLMMNDIVRTADGIKASIEMIRDDGVAVLLSPGGFIERPLVELTPAR